jgi:hypothetical protein
MDTTAKVDLRKLQLLNDRITQVIDALNQVRFSVHGLQHTAGNFIGQIPMTTPWASQTPWGAQMTNPFNTWGLSHTGFSPIPGISPMSTIPGISPWGISPQIPFVNTVGGLNHSDLTDPFSAQRIGQELAARYGQVVPMASTFPYAQAVQYAQTFPYAYVPVSPLPQV